MGSHAFQWRSRSEANTEPARRRPRRQFHHVGCCLCCSRGHRVFNASSTFGPSTFGISNRPVEQGLRATC